MERANKPRQLFWVLAGALIGCYLLFTGAIWMKNAYDAEEVYFDDFA